MSSEVENVGKMTSRSVAGKWRQTKVGTNHQPPEPNHLFCIDHRRNRISHMRQKDERIQG
jgi:hypothetical protein